MTTFWQRWLTLWCIGVGLFGLVLYGAGCATTTGPAAAAFATLGNPLPAAPDRYLRFTTALMGAVSLGWAITLYAAFRAAWSLDRAPATPIWRTLTVGVAIWYAIDSVASVATGFPLNALSNTLLLALYVVPMLASGVLARPRAH